MPLRSASTRPLKMRLIHQNSDHINEILLAWHMNQTPGSQRERERDTPRERERDVINLSMLLNWKTGWNKRMPQTEEELTPNQTKNYERL